MPPGFSEVTFSASSSPGRWTAGAAFEVAIPDTFAPRPVRRLTASSGPRRRATGDAFEVAVPDASAPCPVRRLTFSTCPRRRAAATMPTFVFPPISMEGSRHHQRGCRYHRKKCRQYLHSYTRSDRVDGVFLRQFTRGADQRVVVLVVKQYPGYQPSRRWFLDSLAIGEARRLSLYLAPPSVT